MTRKRAAAAGCTEVCSLLPAAAIGRNDPFSPLPWASLLCVLRFCCCSLGFVCYTAPFAVW